MLIRCFIPGHAVRAAHAGRIADFVICFECYNVRVYVDGRQVAGFLISQSPERVLDRILTDARVSPAGKHGK